MRAALGTCRELRQRLVDDSPRWGVIPVSFFHYCYKEHAQWLLDGRMISWAIKNVNFSRAIWRNSGDSHLDFEKNKQTWRAFSFDEMGKLKMTAYLLRRFGRIRNSMVQAKYFSEFGITNYNWNVRTQWADLGKFSTRFYFIFSID